jgi:hypothetical protein
MTVQELIDELEKVKDKRKIVMFAPKDILSDSINIKNVDASEVFDKTVYLEE